MLPYVNTLFNYDPLGNSSPAYVAHFTDCYHILMANERYHNDLVVFTGTNIEYVEHCNDVNCPGLRENSIFLDY